VKLNSSGIVPFRIYIHLLREMANELPEESDSTLPVHIKVKVNVDLYSASS